MFGGCLGRVSGNYWVGEPALRFEKQVGTIPRRYWSGPDFSGVETRWDRETRTEKGGKKELVGIKRWGTGRLDLEKDPNARWGGELWTTLV